MYSNFILNLYVVYVLNTWPRNPTNNFILKNFLFGTVKLTRNTDKNKFSYNGQGTAFDGKGFWSFDNDTAWNVVTFNVDNTSSPHIDNPKINFLVLGEGPTEGINSSALQQKKK